MSMSDAIFQRGWWLNPTKIREVPKVASREVSGWSHAYYLVGVFVLGFGLFNFAELPLGWKDRVPQVTTYLEATVELGPEWVLPAIWTQKLVELALGLVAAAGLVRRNVQLLTVSIIGWMMVFTLWTFMDVWAADRAELQEHTLYFTAFAQLLILIGVVSVADSVRAWLRRQGDQALVS